VVTSGRTPQAVEKAQEELRREHPGAAVHGCACDVCDPDQVQSLWDLAAGALGGVDHWINNAGIPHPTRTIWELDPPVMETVIRTDLLGVLYGARTAMRGMARQGSGTIWFMEGHGSDGRIMKGLSVYGTAKRAVRYAARALAVEAEGTGVKVCALSPGIMVTDFTMGQVDRTRPEEWERTRRIFNILADTPETVAAFLAPRILSNRHSGALIAWLTGGKILWRFMSASITGRRVIEDRAADA
jgi:NAD(P)-dependent dehydrogenase (short-subunit alcohol dehydrogenase family)